MSIMPQLALRGGLNCGLNERLDSISMAGQAGKMQHEDEFVHVC